MAEIAIGVVGVDGQMGRTLLAEIHDAKDLRIAGGTEHPDNPAIGSDIGTLIGRRPLGLAIGGDPKPLFKASDVVLDFTVPAATLIHSALAAQTRTALIIGTTGMRPAETALVAEAARTVPIVMAGNMSLGVNLLTVLTRQVAAALGEEFDVEILDMHHRRKVDAPSGTALMLGRAAAAGRGQDHDQVALSGRDGHTGARPAGAIGYAALRGGNVVGEHTVIFAADNERIELRHLAGDRGIFARGALRATRWVQGRPPGLYGMIDVLGLST